MVKIFKEKKNKQEQTDQEQNVQDKNSQEQNVQDNNDKEQERNDITIFEEYLKENGFGNVKIVEKNNIITVIVGTNDNELNVSNIINSFKQYDLYADFTISIDGRGIKDTFFVFTPKDIINTDNINNIINTIVRNFKSFTEQDYYSSQVIKEIDGKNKSIIVFSKDNIENITENDVKNNNNYINYKTKTADSPIKYFNFRGITNNPNITSRDILFDYIKKIDRTPVNLMNEFLKFYSLKENSHYIKMDIGVYFFIILNRNKEINDQSISEYGLGNNLQGYATIQKDSSNEFTMFLINTNENQVNYPYLHNKNAKYYKMNEFYNKIVVNGSKKHWTQIVINKQCLFNGMPSYFMFLRKDIPILGRLKNTIENIEFDYCEDLVRMQTLYELYNKCVSDASTKFDKSDKRIKDLFEMVGELKNCQEIKQKLIDLIKEKSCEDDDCDIEKMIGYMRGLKNPNVLNFDEYGIGPTGQNGEEMCGILGLFCGEGEPGICTEKFCNNGVKKSCVLRTVIFLIVLIFVLIICYLIYRHFKKLPVLNKNVEYIKLR